MPVNENISVRFIGEDSSLVASSKRVNTALGNVSRATAKSGKDFTNYGRVLQDLPFGFTAIQNNLTQLIPAAGALGLGFSALISGLTFLQVGTSAWTRGLFGMKEEIKSNTEKLAEAQKVLDEYVAGLEDISKIKLTGLIDAQEELGGLQTLYAASQNLNLSLGERKKAVDLLQERYPAYFKNLSDEAILAGQAKVQYDRLVKSIIAASTARAAQKELDQLAENLRVIQQQRGEAEKLANQAFAAYAERKQRNEEEIKRARQLGQSTIAMENGIVQKAKEHQKVLATVTAIRKQENDLLSRQQKISAEIQALIESQGVDILKTGNELKAPKIAPAKVETNFFDKFLSFDPTKVKEGSKDFAEAFGIAYEYALKNQDLFVGLDKVVSFDTKESAVKEAAKWWSDFQKGIFTIKPQPIDISKDLSQLTKVGTVDFKMKVKPIFEFKPTDLQKTIVDFAKDFSKLAETTGESLGTAIGEGLGAAISGGGISEVFKGIAATVGEFISALGKMLIQAAIVAKAFKAVFTKLLANPAAALAVGVGLVAIGAVIKNSIPKFKGFKTGAWEVPGVGHSDSFPAMLAPGEMVIPRNIAERIRNPNSSSTVNGTGGMFNLPRSVQLIARGRDLVGTLALENSSQRRAFG